MRWLTFVSFALALSVALFAPRGAAPAPPAGPAPPPRELLPLALRVAVARAFAPRLRFNAWSERALDGPQNRNEDFLPASVARFLTDLAAGRIRVVVEQSRGAEAAATALVDVGDAPRFTPAALTGYPRFVAGDPAGTATTYTHVYRDDRDDRQGRAGQGEQVVFVEYWWFYPYDRSEARVLGLTLEAEWDLTGHRADWEHISVKAAIRRDAAGAFQGGRILGVRYYGHGHCHEVPAEELDLFQGRPVVYVSQGKHAAYPEPGEWFSPHVDPRVSQLSDVFLGNGVVFDTWQAPRVDLDDLEHPELNPPAFQTLCERGGLSPLPTWTYYLGPWGPDDTRIAMPGKPEQAVGRSATGPRAKATFGDAWRGHAVPWSTVAATEERLRLYRRMSAEIPQVVPAPAPH